MRDPFIIEVQLKREEVPSFDTYPFVLPAVRNLTTIKLHPHVTFIIGENGSGKSTLLEAIAISMGFNAEGGSRNFAFSTRLSHSDLHKHLRLVKGFRRPKDGYFLRAESFYNVASKIDELDKGAGGPPIIRSYGGTSLHEQSHGESFLALLCERFSSEGLYILDEPEAALSPSRQLSAVARINDLVEAGCQFIIATHSPIIMAYPKAQILQLMPEGIIPVEYEQTEHFQITKQFVNHHERMLRILTGSSNEEREQLE